MSPVAMPTRRRDLVREVVKTCYWLAIFEMRQLAPLIPVPPTALIL